MRAKEYLEINKSKISYYDIVKKAIDDLSLLRNNKRKTEEYFNRYLFSDARFAAQKKGFVLMKGEVSVASVKEVRIDIMNAIYSDESFIFAFNIILMQKNIYFELVHLKFSKIKDIKHDTRTNIERICRLYKEDYPKKHLCDYLLDEMNREYTISKNCLLNGTIEWWNEIFNRTYKQFDDIRVQLVNGFDTLNIVENVYSGDEKMDNEVLELLSYMFKNYSYDLSEVQEKKYKVLSETLKVIYMEKRKEFNLISEPEVNMEKKNDSNNTSESDKNKIIRLEQKIEELKQQLEKDSNVMTCSQQTMALLYLLNHFGINTENTKKSTIARFMHPLIGRNEANIRKRLEYDFDDINVKQNLRIVADTFSEILPSTAEQILKDIEG